MKIIKEGFKRPVQTATYSGHCYLCGCEFECEERETTQNPFGTAMQPSANCPCCNNQVALTIKLILQ